MNPSEKFLRSAAECEFMAKFTHNPENKTVSSRMAERWLRCAEFFESQNSAAHRSSSANILNPHSQLVSLRPGEAGDTYARSPRTHGKT
jgi:hypothetical protein